MSGTELNARIIKRGQELFAAIRSEKPSLFTSNSIVGSVIEWAMRDEKFKLQLLRFVDVFPALKTGDQLTRHIREYFNDGEDLPPILAVAVRSAGQLGGLGGSVLSMAISANIHKMARQFIIGETLAEVLRNISGLRRHGFALSVDLLGEAVLSHEEAQKQVNGYLELLAALKTAAAGWQPLPGKGGSPELDWGDAPLINIAVKPSAVYCLADPLDFERSVTAILGNIAPLVAAVRACNGFLCIDMENSRLKGITLEVYRRLKILHPDYPWLGIALQAYLRDTDSDLEELLLWARATGIPIAVRLVKGAYWDYEMIRAKQNGWQPPVWTQKADSDAAFERQAKRILAEHDVCYFACASHNIRSIAAVLESARELGVPQSCYEFQVLYGMAEPVRQLLLQETGRIRLYAPFGEMVPGMGYLVRRLLENTANDSFLRRTFMEDTGSDSLLEDPAELAKRELARLDGGAPGTAEGSFRNEPAADFTRPELRAAFVAQIAALRSRSLATTPLFINGADVITKELLESVNPADPQEIIARVCLAGVNEAAVAITAARAAFPGWRDTPPVRRAAILTAAAATMRTRLVELAAWQVLEIGKQWDQAYADVAEAIDFLEFYSREMLRLGSSQKLGRAPGEINLAFHEPCGVAAVIAPWNFPLAISCGMAAAALVTGNCVVYKPSSLTPAIGRQLADILQEAGLPKGVFNFLPGRGSVIGDQLVESLQVDLIAFTGSAAVGLGIIEKAAVRRKGQHGIKRVICEMGGKNAIIVDDDADLDEAVPLILQAAFGFQGQKCSACSRVIVLDAIHEKFVERFISAAASLTSGPAEDPGFFLGPVADAEQQRIILEYIETGMREGKLLYQSSPPVTGGFYVPLAIFGDIRPGQRLASEEIFGPVVAVMRAVDFDEALQIAVSTGQALTGAVFSRSPANLEKAAREFRVGNLYLNRGCTGAQVERQPFGGFGLSGGGTKAGGTGYLLHFMNQRIVTENTMRRGFAPAEPDDS